MLWNCQGIVGWEEIHQVSLRLVLRLASKACQARAGQARAGGGVYDGTKVRRTGKGIGGFVLTFARKSALTIPSIKDTRMIVPQLHRHLSSSNLVSLSEFSRSSGFTKGAAR